MAVYWNLKWAINPIRNGALGPLTYRPQVFTKMEPFSNFYTNGWYNKFTII